MLKFQLKKKKTLKKQATYWEKIFTAYILDKRL